MTNKSHKYATVHNFYQVWDCKNSLILCGPSEHNIFVSVSTICSLMGGTATGFIPLPQIIWHAHSVQYIHLKNPLQTPASTAPVFLDKIQLILSSSLKNFFFFLVRKKNIILSGIWCLQNKHFFLWYKIINMITLFNFICFWYWPHDHIKELDICHI